MHVCLRMSLNETDMSLLVYKITTSYLSRIITIIYYYHYYYLCLYWKFSALIILRFLQFCMYTNLLPELLSVSRSTFYAEVQRCVCR